MLFLSGFCYAFMRICLLMPRSHLLGRADLLAIVCLMVKLSLSHWCPGSGMVLECIDPDLCPLSYFDYQELFCLWCVAALKVSSNFH